jgi:hypothetical protein
MKRVVGGIVLGLSACGYPLTQLVIRRWGARGAVVAESVCVGLAIRDAAMVAGGVPGRLRTIPAALLRLELAAGVVASLAGVPPLVSMRPGGRAASPGASDAVWRAAVAALFALHTVRFGIYLRPGQGRVPDEPGPGSGTDPGACGRHRAGDRARRVLPGTMGAHADCRVLRPVWGVVGADRCRLGG